jgi:peptide/nickel transport system permease protein
MFGSIRGFALAAEGAAQRGGALVARAPDVVPVSGPRVVALRRRRRPMPPGSVIFGVVVLLLVVVSAAGADLLAPFGPTAQNLRERLQPPLVGGHLLGSDTLGRDILSRVMYGGRVSLVVGVSAATLAGSLGVLLGLLAGFLGGWWDAVLSRVADVQQAIPFLILAIAVAVILGPSLINVVLVLAVTTWVSYFRVVRAEVLSVRESLLVDAARVMGAGQGRILLRHVLPNVSASIIVIGSVMVANMIIFEASLSFLGLGVPPPTPTWGRMVFEGVQYVDSAWWLALCPGVAIVLTVLAINLIGDWLREVLDPRLG